MTRTGGGPDVTDDVGFIISVPFPPALIVSYLALATSHSQGLCVFPDLTHRDMWRLWSYFISPSHLEVRPLLAAHSHSAAVSAKWWSLWPSEKAVGTCCSNLCWVSWGKWPPTRALRQLMLMHDACSRCGSSSLLLESKILLLSWIWGGAAMS